MKNLLLILAAVATLNACNPFNPSKYSAVNQADMKIVESKMQQKILPTSRGDSRIGYFTDLPKNILSGPSLWLTPILDQGEITFRIDVSTISGPGRGGIIDTDSSGKIIRAWGYSDPCENSYYSERWPAGSKASKEAINFYIGVQRAVVDYIKKYN